MIALLVSPVLNADDTPKTQVSEVQPRPRATAPTSANILRDQLLTMAPQTEIPNNVPGIVKLRKANLNRHLDILKLLIKVKNERTLLAIEQATMLQIALMKLERDEASTLDEKVKIQQTICEMMDESRKHSKENLKNMFMSAYDVYQVDQLAMEAKQDLIQLHDKAREDIRRDQIPPDDVPNDIPSIVKLRKDNLKQQLKIINQMVKTSDGTTPRAVEQAAMLQISLMKLERNEMPTLNEKIKIQQKICETADQSKKRCMKKFEKLLIALPDFYQVEELVMESKQDLIQLQDKMPPMAS